MRRIVDLRIVLDRDDRLRVRVDGVHVVPSGFFAAALHEVARHTLVGAASPRPVPSASEAGRSDDTHEASHG